MGFVIDSRPLGVLRDADVPEDTERVRLWVAHSKEILFCHVLVRQISRTLW